MVVLVVLVAVRNFGMFKIPYCDFSIAVQSVCCLSALVQLVLQSQYDLPTRLSIVTLLKLCAIYRIARLYCDYAVTDNTYEL